MLHINRLDLLAVIAMNTAENEHYLSIKVRAMVVAKNKKCPMEKMQLDNVKEGLSK